MRGLALLLAAMLGAGQAQAQETRQPWEGVWKGTIGTLPVQACFEKRGDDWHRGAYFYFSHLKVIGLDREADGSWIERAGTDGKVTGRWLIQSDGPGGLKGEWQADGKVMPIEMTLAAELSADEQPCGSTAFLKPKFRPAREVTKTEYIGGLPYTEIIYDVGPHFPDVSIASFRYPATQPGDAAINRAVALHPDKPGDAADYLSCVAGATGMGSGDGGEFGLSHSPELISRDFLSIFVSFGNYCGGAHPSYSYWRKVFDRQTGKQVRLVRWLNGKASPDAVSPSASSEIDLSPALRRLVLRHMRIDDADCRSVVQGADYWSLGLLDKAMIFTPSLPHVVQACVDDAQVPFAQMAPFLSPAGKAGVARIKASPR